MKQDKIDILLTTYNTKSEYLKQQLDSIINQTYQNINIIISDDASSNKNVKEILKQYQQKDARITLYFQEKNLGYLKNFEFLLTKSTANYIAFSDHDDIWYNNKIEKCYNELVNNDVSLVYCDARQIDENGKVLYKSYMNTKHMPKFNGRDVKLAFTRSMHGAIGCTQMFTKSIKDRALPFKNSVKVHDWIMIYLATLEKGIKYIDEPLLDYRLHTDNEFGGRNLKQNLAKWKDENKSSYKSYMEYREDVIKGTYYATCKMCNEYFHNDEYNDILKYYENILKVKVINFNIVKYFKYLGFKGISSRAIKEIVLFHFPILGYFKFKLT